MGTTTEGTYGLDVTNFARVNELNVSNGYFTLSASAKILFLNNVITIGYGSAGVSAGTNSISIGGTSTSAYGIAMNGGVATSSAASIAIGFESYSSGIMAIAIGQGSSAETFEFVCGNRETNEQIRDVYFGSGKIRKKGSGSSTNGVGVSYTINGSGAFGTDFAGGNITIAGGKGTGTGTAGDIIFSTSTTTTTGTTLQTLTNRWWIKGTTGTLSNITSPNASAITQIDSTTQGFLPPRMTTTQKNAIGTPAAGLIVYDTTLNKLCVRTASAWETITSI